MRRLGPREVADVPAVAQHGDAVGEAQHVVHAVGDVEDADPLGAELLDDREELPRLGRGER
ncbi:hypothetical protein WME98_53010 [Sorangium sp. So ce296]|uniref:hypothetical protein n=1 Tax=Sorangium sp. So ce296 TaxID=3133296 RepID=UPI003F6143BD